MIKPRVAYKARAFDAGIENPLLAQLWGRWKTDPQDTFSHRHYGNVILDFQPNGILTYIIERTPVNKVLKHHYTLEDNILVVHEVPIERTALFLTTAGKLVLYYAGYYLRYVKE
jgi:hypothetical protein